MIRITLAEYMNHPDSRTEVGRALVSLCIKAHLYCGHLEAPVQFFLVTNDLTAYTLDPSFQDGVERAFGLDESSIGGI